MEKITIFDLFDLSHTLAAAYLCGYTFPWDALPGLSEFIVSLGEELDPNLYDNPSKNVWVSKSATVAPTAVIGAPCVIGHGAEIRHSAYIRGSALIGEAAVVGNSCELKNCILFDGVQVPHFNYVGDSILGYRAHLGAGSVTSNVKSDKTDVVVRAPSGPIYTGRRKLGAMVGDMVEIGCSCVLNPGTVIGRGSSVYPLTSVRGFVPEGHIVKSTTESVLKLTRKD